MGDVIRLADASAVYDVQTIQRLSAVDGLAIAGSGATITKYSHVRCRRCTQEYPSVTAAARFPCPGPKESSCG